MLADKERTNLRMNNNSRTIKNVTLEVLDMAKQSVNKQDFTEQTNYIIDICNKDNTRQQLLRFIPNIYIMGYIDAVYKLRLERGNNNASSEK